MSTDLSVSNMFCSAEKSPRHHVVVLSVPTLLFFPPAPASGAYGLILPFLVLCVRTLAHTTARCRIPWPMRTAPVATCSIALFCGLVGLPSGLHLGEPLALFGVNMSSRPDPSPTHTESIHTHPHPHTHTEPHARRHLARESSRRVDRRRDSVQAGPVKHARGTAARLAAPQPSAPGGDRGGAPVRHPRGRGGWAEGRSKCSAWGVRMRWDTVRVWDMPIGTTDGIESSDA